MMLLGANITHAALHLGLQNLDLEQLFLHPFQKQVGMGPLVVLLVLLHPQG